MDGAAEMETCFTLVNDNSATQSASLYAFPNETQTNSTCNKRLNNIMQALSKVLPQTELYTDIARPFFTSG